ncbi:hypothetical protein SZN_21951, partial [Streptomyces zinciresistens K42]
AASEVVARALASDPALPLAAGGGAAAGEMIRVNHYGAHARRESVDACLTALGAALAEAGRTVAPGAAHAAVAEVWDGS